MHERKQNTSLIFHNIKLHPQQARRQRPTETNKFQLHSGEISEESLSNKVYISKSVQHAAGAALLSLIGQ